MSHISRKNNLRNVIFYICGAAALALLWMHGDSIWLGTIKVLNSLAETFDKLSGK
jgi:hypothetical protein